MFRSTMRQHPAKLKHMCLYPKLFINRKYTPTKKNMGNVPYLKDERIKYVPIGCGNCIECRQQKTREWQVRLTEELKSSQNAYFVTLSFSCEELEKLTIETENTECNATATLAVRRFLERWRKKYKKSVKHWFVTELGHINTERIHLHGIIFTEIKLTNELLQEIWKYGNTYIGDYCSNQTINYIVKYINKIDEDHKDYKSIILCSAGLGKDYITEYNKQQHKYRPNNTKDYYQLPNGQKINLPIYYRNKLFTEDEREQLWLEMLDKHEMYIRGIKITDIDTTEGIENYLNTLKAQQAINVEIGYGSDGQEWKEKEYNITAKMLNKLKK